MSKQLFWYHAPRLCLTVALAAIIGFLVFEFANKAPPAPALGNEARALSALPLVNENGAATSLAAFKGSWVVLFFGYATCPDVCPTSLAYLAQELKQLGSDASSVRGIFVSLDPQRDKPDSLGRYVHYFDPNLTALTGTEENLRHLSKLLGVYFEVQPAPRGSPESAYTLAHTASFFILTPRGELAQTVSPPFARGAVAAVLRTVLSTAAH